MTRWGGLWLIAGVTFWFIATSYLLCWFGHLFGRFQHPYAIALWYYWNDPDPTSRVHLIFAWFIPPLIGMLAYTAVAKRNPHKLTRGWGYSAPTPPQRG